MFSIDYCRLVLQPEIIEPDAFPLADRCNIPFLDCNHWEDAGVKCIGMLVTTIVHVS